ncbi:hypothetical protein [Leptolyngbya sp. FACHB-261]|uniref:hypothetical protein n=1 Tax=Leptolyngbya sp. FACHB-261 TaxID=2692806 RepID=UPI0016820B96|nr:hypothetical protein [Leptolyngbya sp. FACHB-261]
MLGDVTPSLRLQQLYRDQLSHGQFVMPELQRWEKGVPFWGELFYLSQPEADYLRTLCPRSSHLPGPAPTIGIQLCASSLKLSERLAVQINETGYGGLVQFEDLADQDCFLRIAFGASLYPVIVMQSMLREFWLQLTLNACRHSLTVTQEDSCLGYWESDLLLPRL